MGEEQIRAPIEVETSGGGFDRQGCAKMLFEPHVFWRKFGPGRCALWRVRQSLAYSKWECGPVWQTTLHAWRWP
ncbi:N-acetylmuramidase domain-containing protein [Falsirhodobacter halotolerans]|uniref:N-acetylmuramidase domain-containing protein n=1 Tax=Falsirhodobacter halotolerans TaxID=1146892 RepID=UPI003CC7CF28